VISIILIKFNDTNELNDKEKVYSARKVAPSGGDVNRMVGVYSLGYTSCDISRETQLSQFYRY